MRGLRATLSVSVDVESYYLRSHGAFYCCCRYEDDSCLRCEIVFDYRSHCFMRRVGLWRTAVATLEVWVCGPVLSLPLDHWKREIYVVKYFNKKKRFFFCKITSDEIAWKLGGMCLEMGVLHISTGIAVRVKMLLDAAFRKNVFLALYLLSRIITGLAVGCLRFNSPIFVLNYFVSFLFIVP